MQPRRLAAIAIFLVTLSTLLIVSEAGGTKNIADANFTGRGKEIYALNSQLNIQQNIQNIPPQVRKIAQRLQSINFSPRLNQFAPVEGCELKPPANPSLPAKLTNQAIALSRFRRLLPVIPDPPVTAPVPETVQEPVVKTGNASNLKPATQADVNPNLQPDRQPNLNLDQNPNLKLPNNPQSNPEVKPQSKPQIKPQNQPKPAPPQMVYSPREIIALAANSNYGDRYLQDVRGNAASIKPIIVLHETVAPANSVINYFQAFQTNEDNQASYHTMIARDGTVIYFVPPDKRAFGAGNSVFATSSAKEAIQTNPKYPSSVNNFAYHISLETPPDGMHNGSRHGGYTEAQYNSLAWLVAKTDVPFSRITTHRDVDRSGSRIDPRSFNFPKFQNLLNTYPRTREIAIGCQ